jgi:hypothetical protein
MIRKGVIGDAQGAQKEYVASGLAYHRTGRSAAVFATYATHEDKLTSFFTSPRRSVADLKRDLRLLLLLLLQPLAKSFGYKRELVESTASMSDTHVLVVYDENSRNY